VILSFIASQFTTVVLFGQFARLYQHDVSTFLNSVNLPWSFLQVVPMALMILLVHTIDYSRCYVRWWR
jgi:phospholipid/cholesterol/gamma-HCH transport system permease protein